MTLAVLTILAACRTASHSTGSLVAVDDAGDTLRLAGPARRIVSLMPTTTELVFAIGAGDLLVGRTRWCDYPAAALAVPDVGDAIPPSVEAVLARHPDLVLLYNSGQNAEPAARFREAGVGVLRLQMDRLRDVSRLARLLGPLVGEAGRADSVAGAFDSSLAREAAQPVRASRPRVLLLAWDQPPMAIGAGSFQSEILRLAGGDNVFDDLAASSATVSIETIAARDPDIILVTDTGPPAIRRRSEWSPVRAVREDRFLHVTDPAFGRPGPRAPQVVEELRTLLAGVKP